MEFCDVLVVGGGPAGSTCAGLLKKAGLNVLLMDMQTFPRHKPCAGWITPDVLKKLEITVDEYSRGQVCQNITSFRTGLMNSEPVLNYFGTAVSYGIRRYEFDHFLLQRCAVRVLSGERLITAEKTKRGWLVNGRIRTRLLVGAGGHFCPVARLLGARIGHEPIVVAQVTEYLLNQQESRVCMIDPETPELFFSRDMKGYGWLFRKKNYINIGLGRMDSRNFVLHTDCFINFLKLCGKLPSTFNARFNGHAYRVFSGRKRRNCIGDGALLIGDAAGVANPRSGEGILPAIESAIEAADAILTAGGDYRHEKLEPYVARLGHLFAYNGIGIHSVPGLSPLSRRICAMLLSSKWFNRHVVLEHWFLQSHLERN